VRSLAGTTLLDPSLIRSVMAAESAFESARGEAADAARRRLDLEDLVARVDQLAPAAGEPESLRGERERLRHLDELAAAAGTAAERLSPADGDGARELAASAAQELSAVAGFAPELGDVAATLDDIAARIQDAAVELRGHLAGLEADPARLELVESRLEAFDFFRGACELLLHMERGIRDGHDAEARTLPQILMLEFRDGDVEFLQAVFNPPEHHALVLE